MSGLGSMDDRNRAYLEAQSALVKAGQAATSESASLYAQQAQTLATLAVAVELRELTDVLGTAHGVGVTRSGA